jgi:hypothetical protein
MSSETAPRHLPETIEQRRKFMARPDWTTVFGILETRTANDWINKPLNNRHMLLVENRGLLKEYYEAVASSYKGSYRRIRRFNKQYKPDGNPQYDQGLEFHMGVIRSMVLEPKGQRRPR